MRSSNHSHCTHGPTVSTYTRAASLQQQQGLSTSEDLVCYNRRHEQRDKLLVSERVSLKPVGVVWKRTYGVNTYRATTPNVSMGTPRAANALGFSLIPNSSSWSTHTPKNTHCWRYLKWEECSGGTSVSWGHGDSQEKRLHSISEHAQSQGCVGSTC